MESRSEQTKPHCRRSILTLGIATTFCCALWAIDGGSDGVGFQATFAMAWYANSIPTVNDVDWIELRYDRKCRECQRPEHAAIRIPPHQFAGVIEMIQPNGFGVMPTNGEHAGRVLIRTLNGALHRFDLVDDRWAVTSGGKVCCWKAHPDSGAELTSSRYWQWTGGCCTERRKH